MKTPSIDWARSNVLVTGATGLVGSQLVRRLLAHGAHVVCFVRDHDPASALWFSGDIDRVAVATGRLEVFEHVKAAIVEREINTIFHLGAQAIVGAGYRDPLATFATNALGTCHILEACRLYAPLVKQIIVASSDKAYGESPTLPYIEATPLAARNPYDVSKSCTDLVSQSFAASYGLPVAIARCGNIFGPGDLNWNRLVPGTIRSLLHAERPVIRSDGSLIRDYLYVEDAVDAYMALADWIITAKPNSSTPRAFNFSSNQPLTVLEMTRLIQTACGRTELEPIIENRVSGEITAQHLDSSRAAQELNWTARQDLILALQKTVQWYQDYLDQHDIAPQSLMMPQPSLRRRATA